MLIDLYFFHAFHIVLFVWLSTYNFQYRVHSKFRMRGSGYVRCNVCGRFIPGITSPFNYTCDKTKYNADMLPNNICYIYIFLKPFRQVKQYANPCEHQGNDKGVGFNLNRAEQLGYVLVEHKSFPA
jgi:hypothetical protein